jgi:hypothetical protein
MKTKLTMVSIYIRGWRLTMFLQLPLDPDGKVRFDYEKSIKLPRGTTYCPGG